MCPCCVPLLQPLSHFGNIQGFDLWGTSVVISDPTETQLRRLTLTFREYTVSLVTAPQPGHRIHIFQGLMFQIKRALADVKMGRWAELLQASIPF